MRPRIGDRVKITHTDDGPLLVPLPGEVVDRTLDHVTIEIAAGVRCVARVADVEVIEEATC